jgi:hypothetical protein
LTHKIEIPFSISEPNSLNFFSVMRRWFPISHIITSEETPSQPTARLLLTNCVLLELIPLATAKLSVNVAKESLQCSHRESRAGRRIIAAALDSNHAAFEGDCIGCSGVIRTLDPYLCFCYGAEGRASTCLNKYTMLTNVAALAFSGMAYSQIVVPLKADGSQ